MTQKGVINIMEEKLHSRRLPSEEKLHLNYYDSYGVIELII